MNRVQLYLIDDHQIMREGLRLVLAREPDFAVVGESGDGAEALTAIEQLRPDVAVLDIEMPGLNGIEVAERLRDARPDIKVLILSGAAETSIVHAALRAGVSGYLMKADAALELVRAVRAIVAGEVYFCPVVSAVLARDYGRTAGGQPAAKALSGREKEILRLIADGRTTKEMAFALGLSTKTIETHRAHLMAKLGIYSVAGLTKYALREHLTSL